MSPKKIALYSDNVLSSSQCRQIVDCSEEKAKDLMRIMLSPIKIGLVSVCLVAGLNLQAAVVISSPANGVTVASPIQLHAAVSGTQPASIFVYDNNSLILQEPGVSSIETSLNLSAGSHTIVVQASYNRNWNASATSKITVSAQQAPVPPPAPAPPTSSSAWWTEIASDMSGTNEGFPHGVPPSWDWAQGPVLEMGTNANGWKALTGWGVVYEAAQGNPATNSRVNLRNFQTYFLQKSSGKWLLLQNTSSPAGEAYLEDFSGDTSKPGDVRNEPDGTISVTAGCPQNCGYNFHFYPADRASINPNDIGGILVIFQARLIVGNPTLPDDRSIARYLTGSGADYYPALTGGWPGNLTYNPGCGIGKEKYVQTQWRFYSMTTLSAAQLTANPPPVDLTNIAP